MSKEIWKDVIGYEGFYQVSNLGRVKSLKRSVIREGRRSAFVPEKIMKGTDNGEGYLQVHLCGLNKRKVFKIHKLVAIAFLNHIPDGNKLVVDHSNNIKSDNRVVNIQLISHRQNCSKDRTGSSKYTGVCWVESKGKWSAGIRIGKEKKHLGMFINEIDAHNAYQEKLKSIL